MAFTWVSEGKRKQGGPRETFRRMAERDIKDGGLGSWAGAVMAAGDRET